jgi:chaperonin cofactor prefoldin
LPDVFKALEGKVGNDHETIYRKVGRIFFKDYDQEEKDKI